MSTQTALALTEIGKPLTQITLPIPDDSELNENEILIKITAAGRRFDILLLVITYST
jgi:NADPH2:quinone reductase